MMMMILTHSGLEHPLKTFILNEMTVLWESCHRVFLWAGRLQASRVTSLGTYNILRVQWVSKRRGGQSCWLVPGSTRTCELSKDICLLWVRTLICHWFGGNLCGTNPFYPYLLCSTLKSDFGKSHLLTVFFFLFLHGLVKIVHMAPNGFALMQRWLIGYCVKVLIFPPNTSEFFNFSDTLILTPLPKAPTSLRIPEQKL